MPPKIPPLHRQRSCPCIFFGGPFANPALRRVGLGHLAGGDSPRGSPWNGCGWAAETLNGVVNHALHNYLLGDRMRKKALLGILVLVGVALVSSAAGPGDKLDWQTTKEKEGVVFGDIALVTDDPRCPNPGRCPGLNAVSLSGWGPGFWFSP